MSERKRRGADDNKKEKGRIMAERALEALAEALPETRPAETILDIGHEHRVG